MKKTGVSVVIPSYNCKKILFRLLDSLKKSDHPVLEVIVVDNGSKDKTLNEGRKKYSWVKWIDAGEKILVKPAVIIWALPKRTPKII